MSNEELSKKAMNIIERGSAVRLTDGDTLLIIDNGEEATPDVYQRLIEMLRLRSIEAIVVNHPTMSIAVIPDKDRPCLDRAPRLLDRGAVSHDPCIKKGDHDVHETADGMKWYEKDNKS